MKPNRFTHDSDKPFHTHEYAKAAGETMGSTSSQSFSERYRIDQNRKHIKKYRDSHVATGSHLRQELRARLDGEDGQVISQPQQAPAPSSGRQTFNTRNEKMSTPRRPGAGKPALPPKPGFREPPTRGFNPYG